MGELKQGIGDLPPKKAAEDLLNRKLLARHIYNLAISQTTDEQAVRIGVYGKWGEGKTGLINFIKEAAEHDAHITYNFTPWAITNPAQLWREFTTGLIGKLEQEGICEPAKSFLGLKRRGSKLLASDFVQGLNEVFDERIPYNTGAILRFLQNQLGPSKEEVSAVFKKLNGRKVFVFIDDLDRADPSVIPQLLLALREILDQPGFIFIVAFDLDIVSRALGAHHPAWQGDTFIEKVVDFPFFLPSLSEEEALAFFRHHIKACDFLPQDDYQWLAKNLPSSPRKIKLLVRNIYAMRSELIRHDADEIDYKTLFLSQLLRMESHLLMEVLQDSYLGAGQFEWMHLLSNDDSKKKAAMTLLNDTLKEVGLSEENISAQQRKHLESLIHSWVHAAYSARGGADYQLSFFVRPHPITWGEFRKAFKLWQNKGDRALQEWFAEHLQQREVTIEDLAKDFFQSLVGHRGQLLSRAAESGPKKQLEELLGEAEQALALISKVAFTDSPPFSKKVFLTPKNFAQVYGQAREWAHFTRNTADKKAREAELLLLQKLIKQSFKDNPEEYLNILAKDDPRGGLAVKERKAIIARLTSLLEKPVAERFIEYFSQEAYPIMPFRQYDGHEGFRDILLDKDSPLYKPKLRQKFEGAILAAGSDASQHHKVLDLAEWMVDWAKHNPSQREKMPLTDLKFLKILWQGLVKEPIQFRMASSIHDIRQGLLEYAKDETLLPMPVWLKNELAKLDERLEEERSGTA